MKDIRLLCVVLLIGGLMGAALNREELLVVKKLVWADSNSKGGIGVLLTEKDLIRLTMSAQNDVCTNFVVGDQMSVLVMTDSKGQTRLEMGVSKDGFTSLVFKDSKGKAVWGIIADKNGKVKTIGH